jgi:hypothetical protein
MRGQGRLTVLLFLVGSSAGAAGPPEGPETGFLPEVTVKQPTRLDWQFVARGLSAGADRLPADYASDAQHYQLFIPANYRPTKAWPLVIFVSPGDDPLGWRCWQTTCEAHDVLFCAAYGAGNRCAPGRRVRIVLDVLDDVRRRCRVDPEQTYLCGLGGGARLACDIAFALPEYFGGVVPVCGGGPLNALPYLRHRVADRLSVAWVTGADDFNRREIEDYHFPLLAELGVRSRLWVVGGMGHALPPPAVVDEVYAWLKDDLARRQADARGRPGLAASPDDVPTNRRRADGALAVAKADLARDERLWRGVALLRGMVARWEKTEAADRARALLKEIEAGPARRRRLAEQESAERRRDLAARAKALERSGQGRSALGAWEELAKAQPGADEAGKADQEAKRLRAALAARPYLGLALEGEGAGVSAVVAGGPAARAGLRPGDRLLKVGADAVGSLADLRRALEAHKPGDRLALEVQRDGKVLPLTVEVGCALDETPSPETRPSR